MKDWIKNGWFVISGKQTSILSAAFVIGGAWGVSAVLGIIRYRLIYAKFLSCCAGELDAYNAAFRLPDLVFQLVVTGALSAAFIPVFSQKLAENEEKANRLASGFLTILVTLFFGLAILLIIFARPLSLTMAGGFLPYQIDLMTRFTRWLLLAQLMFLVSNFLTGIIQSHQRFLVPALSPVAYNLGIILGVWLLSPVWGIGGAVAGVIIGAGMHLAIQVPLVVRLGFKFLPSWDWRDSEVRRIFKLMLPRTAALAVSQIEATAVVIFAAALSAGSLSLFYLAQTLANLPVNIFGVTLGQAALPALSQVGERKREEFSELVVGSVLQVLFLALPATALLVVLRVPVVRLAFGAKTFPWAATLLTGRTLALFAGWVIGGAMVQILARSFYALHDTKTPFYWGAGAVIVNVVLGFIFISAGWGILGLAVAFSVSALVHAGGLGWSLRKWLAREQTVSGYRSFGKMLLSSLVMAAVLWVVMRVLDRYVLDTTRVWPLVGLTAAALGMGGGIYIGLCWFLRVNQLWSFVSLLTRFGKWKEALGASER